MSFIECFMQAFDTLKNNKFRSILTMVGIVMGVFSVITIIAIGNTAQAFMDLQFEKLGANIIQITEKNKAINQKDWLVLSDIDTIEEAIPEIKNIHAFMQLSGEVNVGTEIREAVVVGLTPQSKNFRTIEMLHGRFFSEIEIRSRANVAIVDENFARRYFKKSDIVGETINLKNTEGTSAKLTVIGVVKGGESIFESTFGDEYPVEVKIPLSTAQAFYGSKKLNGIEVSVVDKDKLKTIGERIIKVIEFTHGNKNKYIATNSVELQKSLSSVLDVVSMILFVIAVITLIVGGIGIVNILLVSVSERVCEIGLRKALGARKRDIIFQFLTESVIMTATSGLIGVILGIITGTIISKLVSIPPVVDLKLVVLAFMGSITLGVIFGVYPAKKATDLDPIEALRE